MIISVSDVSLVFFFFQAEDGIRDHCVTGVQTCALPIFIVPLLGPVADKLGIDLIWFGVLLGVNMQTSFMHPPFGFALFYLRSVAPGRGYLDKLTSKLTPPVTTGQIYSSAVPFVVLQGLMVGIGIGFP